MCLYTYHRFPKRAKEDIKCYKIIEINRSIVMTPCIKSIIGLINDRNEVKLKNNGVLKGGKLISYVSTLIMNKFSKRRTYSISGGFIHSYSDRPRLNLASFNDIREIKDPCRNLYLLTECIIPKGTLYYIGNDKDYASRKLIINKIL